MYADPRSSRPLDPRTDAEAQGPRAGSTRPRSPANEPTPRLQRWQSLRRWSFRVALDPGCRHRGEPLPTARSAGSGRPSERQRAGPELWRSVGRTAMNRGSQAIRPPRPRTATPGRPQRPQRPLPARGAIRRSPSCRSTAPRREQHSGAQRPRAARELATTLARPPFLNFRRAQSVTWRPHRNHEQNAQAAARWSLREARGSGVRPHHTPADTARQ